MSEENGKLKLINRKVLFGLSQESYEVGQKSSAIKTNFSERMKHHKDASNLDAWAANLCFRLDAMDPDKRNLKLAHLDAYLDMFRGRWGTEGHVGDFFDEQSEQEADEAIQQAAAEAKQQDENARLLTSGIKELPAEEAAKDAAIAAPKKRGRPSNAEKAARAAAAAENAEAEEDPAPVGSRKPRGMPSAPVGETLN